MNRSHLAALALLAPLSFAPSIAGAQTPYLVSQSIGAWSEITSGGTIHTPVQYGGLPAWDEGFATVTLPFSFTWYGQAYSTLYVYSNGFVSFSPPPLNTSFLTPPTNVPNPFNPIHNFIGVLWADLDAGASPEIRSLVTGVSPSRIFTVQLRGMQAFANPLSSVAFQVRLYESSNTFEAIFGPNNGVNAVGTTAMENATGTEGMNLMVPAANCAGNCSCDPGTCGSLNWQPQGRTITITLPTGPELAGDVFAPPGAFPGTNFDAVVSIRNLGLSDTGSFRYQLRLSQTNSSTIGSTLLQTVNVPGGIAPASTITSTRTLTMPANAGVADYYVALIIDLDDDVDEAIETNNLVFTPDPISTGPDLLGTLTAPGTGGPGEPIDVVLSIISDGAPVTSPLNIAFYLSEDDIQGPGDLPMGTALFTLPDGFAGTESITLTLPENAPPSPPNYQILAIIDDQDAVQETNEFNNVAASDLVRLEGPDIEATAIDAGAFAFLGLPYPVIATITNEGGATARNITVCVVISENQLISVISDPILIETPPMTLQPGEIARVNLAPVIPVPTSTGAYYVAVVGDCADTLQETLETNNVKRRVDQINIRTPAADFAPLEVSTATSAAAGETVPVSARIGNIGNTSGAAIVRFVISQNSGTTVDDPTIYETAMPVTIAPNMETTVTAWASLPGDLGSGAYWIGAIVDPLDTLDEVYEDNNALGTGPIAVSGANVAIITPNPPNAVIGVPFVRRFSAVGGTGSFTWSIEYLGDTMIAGLTFDPATAELRGTPEASAEGRHELRLRVTSGNVSAVRDYTLFVTQPTIPLSVVSSRLPPALRLESYQVQLIAVGGTPPYRWQVQSGNVPNGLGLSDDGELGGEPQDDPDGYSFTVAVTDLAGITATGVVSIDVIATDVSVSITNADIANALVGQYYEQFFTVAGGTAPHTWRLDVDAQIPGMTFNAGEASFTGTPTVAGDYPLIVEVRDANGLIDRNAYVFEVLAPGDLVITTGNSSETQLPRGIAGTPYLAKDGSTVRLRAVQRSGGDPAALTWTLVDGSLAPGLTLDATSGVIAGTPTAEGNYPFRVLATNPSGDFAFSALVIGVDPAGGVNAPGGDDGCGCTSAKNSADTSIAWFALFAAAALLIRGRRTLPLLALLIAQEARAQVPYQVSIEPHTYQELANAVPIAPELGDGNTVEIVLPFTFYLYGEPATRVYVNANGFISTTNVGFGHHYPPNQNPDPFGFEDGFIAGLWDDWCANQLSCSPPFVGGINVYYAIDAAAGTASFEWRHTKHFSDSSVASDINFTITLFAGLSSRIEFTYGTMTQGISFSQPTFFNTRIGLESEDGLQGMWIAPCAGVNSCAFANIDTLENQKITIVADAGEDIAIDNVDVPPIGYPGVPLSVTARLLSRHGEPLGPTRVAAYVVSTSATSTAGAPLVYAGEPITLGPFESRNLSIDAEIPNDLPIGNYRIAVVADYLNELAETDEANNFNASRLSVRIADRAPDFRVVRVRPLSVQAAPNGPLQIAYAVENRGNEPGNLQVQAYLSSNEAITTSDLAFGTVIAQATVPRQVLTGTITANLPSGLPTGTYYVGMIADQDLAVAELSESNNVGRSPITVVVASSNVQILTEVLPPATLGSSYSTNIAAAGGNGQFTFRLADGTLPRGMNFDAAEAEVFGIPLEVGSFPLELEARSGSSSDRQTFTLEVLDPTLPMRIVTTALPVAVLGQDYAESIRVIGGVPPYAWRVVGGNLPRGILLGTDGVVFGQPSAVAITPFTVEIRDNGTTTSSASFVFETRAPGNLTITSAFMPDAVVGEDYYQALFAIGGTGDIEWQAITEPPPGLIIDAEGAVRGVPERAIHGRFSVRAIDRVSGVEDTNILTLNVVAEGRFGISTPSLPEGVPGQEYRVVIKADGGKKPYTWTIVSGEGGLPPAFDARPSLGAAEGETADDFVIDGTFPAEREGVWTFTVRIADAEGRVDDQPFALISRRIVVEEATTVDDGGCSCTAGHSSKGERTLFLPAFVLLALLVWRRRAALTAALSVAAFAAVFAPSTANAQVYIAAQYASTFTPITGGTNLLFLTTSQDDGAEQVAIGFPFLYYGTAYTHVNVGVNGIVAFAAPCGPSLACQSFDEFCNAQNVCERNFGIGYDPEGGFPNVEEPDNAVAPWWDDQILDLFQVPLSTIKHLTTGTAPNREFIVEYNGIRHYDGGSGTQSRASYQLRLSEASGSIRFAYGPYVASAADNADWNGVMGIDNFDHSEGVPGLPCATGIGSFCTFTTLQSLQNQVIEFAVPNSAELVGNVTGPTGAEPGSSVTIPVEVRNIGPQPASTPFNVDVYLSSDSTISTADTLLGTLTFNSVAAQSAATLSLTATIDAATPPGYYRVGAIIDTTNTVPEGVETNNIAIDSRLFLVGLDVSVMIADVESTGPNESILVPITVVNYGAAVSSLSYELYLSSNTTRDAGDRLIGSGAQSIPAQPSTQIDVAAFIPADVIPGDYYFIAVVDPANTIIEADETNNEATTQTATELTGPDVVVASITGESFVFLGEPFTVTSQIDNRGASTASDFYVSFHLSDNQLVTFTDYLIGTLGPITLGPGESRSVTGTWTISSTLAPGLYYLGAIGDVTSVILEENEVNNVRFIRPQLTVRDVAPDFSAADIRLPNVAAAGESFVLERTLNNQGNAPGALDYTIYLSVDQTIDPATDYELARLSTNLAVRTESHGTDNLRIPERVPGGAYYVGYVLDPANQVSELFEDNNTAISAETIDVVPAQLTILTRELPIATMSLPYAFVLAAAGGSSSYTWTQTAGTLPPGLSFDAQGRFSGTPTEEGRFMFSISVSDGALEISRDFEILVAEQHAPLAIVTASLLPAFVGREYSYPLTAFGGVPPYRWAADAAMPVGLLLTEEGLITGTPALTTIESINFTVTDATGERVTRPLIMRIVQDDAAVRFSDDVLPDGVLGEMYDEDVRVEPGTGESPYVFELASGELPAGLALEENRVRGIPERVGEFTVGIRVTDARGDFDLNLFILRISEDSGVTISTTSLPSGVQGVEYKDEIGAPIRVKAFASGRGSAMITYALADGALPAGLSLGTDGLISGTPSAAGVYAFLVQANDDAGQTDVRALAILIDAPALEEPTQVIDDGCGCTTESSRAPAGSLLVLLGLGVLFFARRRSALLIAAAVAAAPSIASAQMYGPYFVSTQNETYVSRTGGTPIGWFSNDDDEAVVNIPFAFKYYNNTFTSVLVGTNGLLTFDTNSFAFGIGFAIPDSSEPNNMVAPFQDDLVIGAGTTHLEGVAPHRVFIIQWENVTRFGAASGTTQLQVRLHEGQGGKLEIAYGPAVSINAGSWTAIAGMENGDASLGFYFLSCQNNCTGADLVSMADKVIVAQQDAGNDVFAGSITVPPIAYAGVPFDVEHSYFSLTAAVLGPFRYQIHLVEAGDTVPDQPLYTSDFVSLAPYANTTATASIAVPLGTPEGRYRLALVVDSDDAIDEPDETNVVFSEELRIAPPQPDFRIAQIQPSQQDAAPGQTISALVSFQNGGNLDGEANWKVYLSRNNVISTDDLEVGSGVISLPLLTTSSVAVNIALDAGLAPGSYWIGAVIDTDNTVRELSEVNNSGATARPISVATDEVEVTSTDLPRGYAGVDYDTYLTAQGGDGSYVWSITQGSLPTGLALISTTGEIRGTPTAAGDTTITVQATSGSRSGTAQVTIEIDEVAAGLVIQTRELLPGIVGAAYPPSEQRIVAAGGSGPITFSLESTLPLGLTLDPDGLLHGTPQDRGVFTLRVQATDGTATAARTLLLTIGEPGRLALVAAILPDAVIGEEFNYVLRTIGQTETATLTFSTTDSLPPGIVVQRNGRIAGVPEVVGQWQFTVFVVEGDAADAPRDSASYVLTVTPEPGFRISPSVLPDGVANQPYIATFNAIGGTPPFGWRIEGELPEGLTVVTEIPADMRETYVIRGTPPEEGFATVLISVEDAVGRRAMGAFALRVLPEPAPPLMMTDGDGCGCAAASDREPADWGKTALSMVILAGLAISRRRRAPSR